MYKNLMKVYLLNLEVNSILSGAVPGRTVKGRELLTQHCEHFLSASSCVLFSTYLGAICIIDIV